MQIRLLEQLGLTKNQSSVYISLLKLGSTTAQNIIKESGMHRSRVYDSLERLENLGLVSYVVKDYKKYFQAAAPEKLLDYIDEKKEIINASIYKGKEGIKTIHSEMLKEGKVVHVLGAKGMIFKELPYFIPNFEKERIRKKIKFILLYDKQEVKEFEKNTVKRKMFKGKSLPRGFESKSVVNIFGNKVAIVLWKDYPSGFIIENKDVADSFRKWFELIYKKLK